jgi:hypothetical protein
MIRIIKNLAFSERAPIAALPCPCGCGEGRVFHHGTALLPKPDNAGVEDRQQFWQITPRIAYDQALYKVMSQPMAVLILERWDLVKERVHRTIAKLEQDVQSMSQRQYRLVLIACYT